MASTTIGTIRQDIAEAYQADDRPWVIGFSGGKDSTALLQLAYSALKRLPPDNRKKHIYVVCTDTADSRRMC
ncbi:MAG: hypothetical protein KGJ60_15750 [Verrucomicrobiota bacterium]|nr:hypothetical protein [Verrucomicrobiota bacterium]